MKHRLQFWLLALASAGMFAALPAWAQDRPASGGQSAAEEGPSEANPGGGEAEEESAQQQRRRRFVTTTSAELKLGDDKSISIVTGILKSDSPDYESVAKLEAGDVLLLTRSQAIKLKTDVAMTFGDVTLKTENVAAGYPGVYGIWLRKTADGWNFIFNEKPDLWGTMYDSSADVAEIAVEYATLAEPKDALIFELPKEGDSGAIKISWGEHQWTAPFTLAH